MPSAFGLPYEESCENQPMSISTKSEKSGKVIFTAEPVAFTVTVVS